MDTHTNTHTHTHTGAKSYQVEAPCSTVVVLQRGGVPHTSDRQQHYTVQTKIIVHLAWTTHHQHYSPLPPSHTHRHVPVYWCRGKHHPVPGGGSDVPGDDDVPGNLWAATDQEMLRIRHWLASGPECVPSPTGTGQTSSLWLGALVTPLSQYRNELCSH